MPTLYCDARNGNDTASGTTWAASKKTLGATITAASSNDTIIAVGAFNEVLVAAGTKHLTFTANGFAVLDGKNALTTGVTNSTASLWIFNGFAIQNFVNGTSNTQAAYAYTRTIQLIDCVVRNCSTSGVWQPDNSLGARTYLLRTLIYGCVNGIVNGSGGGGNGQYVELFNCTVTGCTYGIVDTNGYTSGDITGTNNIFSGNTTHIYTTGTFRTVWDFNDIDFSSGNCSYGGATKTTLAAWRTACGRDANSVSAAPAFVDSAKNCYRLGVGSGAIIAGVLLGAFGTKLAYGISNNVNEPLWSGAAVSPGGGAALDGSDNWALASGTDATVTFETADWGVARNVRKINLQYAYAGLGSGVGGGPESILDYDESDTLPETWQYRVAISLDGSSYGAFATKNLYDDINISARRLKIEVTLRNDA